MAFYMITRVKSKEAWHGLSADEREKWISARIKAREYAGIKSLARYRSYLGRGLTLINEVPSVDAWDEFFQKLRDPKGLDAGRYFDWEDDFCHKRD